MQRLLIASLLLLVLSCGSKKDEKQPEENWVLSNKKIFTDKLNVFGLPDTTYTKMYTYENSAVVDSSEIFAVSNYDNNRRLISKSFFQVRKDSLPLLKSRSNYIYSGKYLANATDETNGVLTKNEKYVYDTSGKILKYSIVRLKNFDKIFEKGDDRLFAKESLINQGYDTLLVTYKYDANNKNVEGNFFDTRGNLIRKDVNIYSANSPISTYTFGPKGDTLQRTTYVQQGSKLTSQVENNDFIIVTAMNSGFLTGKISFDKNKNEKLKQEWSYENGRISEERGYISKQSNTSKK